MGRRKSKSRKAILAARARQNRALCEGRGQSVSRLIKQRRAENRYMTGLGLSLTFSNCTVHNSSGLELTPIGESSPDYEIPEGYAFDLMRPIEISIPMKTAPGAFVAIKRAIAKEEVIQSQLPRLVEIPRV